MNQCEVILKNIETHLERNDKEISILIDEYSKHNIIKSDEFKIEFENSEKQHQKINKKKLLKLLDKKPGELEPSEELQKINKNDLLVSYNFNSLYPSAQTDLNGTRPKTETTYRFKKDMNETICTLFNCGRWSDLHRSAFSTVEYHSPEILIFQHLPVKEKIKNPYKNKRLEEVGMKRNGIIIDTMTKVDVVKIVKYGGVLLEVFEGFFSHNLEYNLYTDFVTDMFGKGDLFISQGKDMLQNLVKEIGLSVYGGNSRQDLKKEFKCVPETWMRGNADDRVKEWSLLKKGDLIVNLEDDEGIDDYDKAKSINVMPSQFGSYILSHSKRLMNDLDKQIGGFYNNSIYYTDAHSLYIHKKYWPDLVDNGFVGKPLGLEKIDYGNSGIFYAWFLVPKTKYCLVIDDFGVISARRTFKGYSEEHRLIKLNEFISLSEGNNF